MNELFLPMLDKWEILNNVMGTFTEEQIRTLLDHECNTRKRASYIERLHQRFCILRAERERVALMTSTGNDAFLTRKSKKELVFVEPMGEENE